MPSSKPSPTSESWAYSVSSIGRGLGVLVATVYLRIHDKLDSIETVGILGALALGHQLPKILGTKKKGGSDNARNDA